MAAAVASRSLAAPGSLRVNQGCLAPLPLPRPVFLTHLLSILSLVEAPGGGMRPDKIWDGIIEEAARIPL
jgi:hypothetical protein